MVEILPSQTKGQYSILLKTKLSSSTPYKHGWISWTKYENNQVQKSPKISSPYFYYHREFSPLSLFTMAIAYHHCHRWLDHHPLHHKQQSDHLTWWLHKLSLSSANSFFPPSVASTGHHLCHNLSHHPHFIPSSSRPTRPLARHSALGSAATSSL